MPENQANQGDGIDKSHHKSRRGILKLAAAGSTSPLFFSETTVAQSNSKTILEMTAKDGEPLSKKQIDSSLKKFFRMLPNSRKENKIVYGVPDYEIDTDIYSYVLKVGRDGRPVSFVGTSSVGGTKAKSVTRRGVKVRSEVEGMDTIESLDSSTDDTMLQKSSQDDVDGVTHGSDWEDKSVVTAYEEHDAGELTITAQPAQYDDELDGKDDAEYWAWTGSYRMVPYHYHGSARINFAETKQDWTYGVFSPVEPYISSTDPTGEVSGESSFQAGISYGTAGISGTIGWQYSQPEIVMAEVTDKSNGEYFNYTHDYDNQAAWQYIAETGYGSTFEPTCGSACWIENTECSGIGQFSRVESMAQMNGVWIEAGTGTSIEC
ncbi:hypothetical protein [Natronobacterium lacisalsi]|uniref:hypothetical protein n=1 Tax=Natronobacterium lacisalsi TaxID=229731 RepID=UPI00126914DF|nr:hypothetical protein [Halobiforma lacisalsi]